MTTINPRQVAYQLELPELPDDFSPVAGKCKSLGLNIKRLQFVRWLVSQNRLSETRV